MTIFTLFFICSIPLLIECDQSNHLSKKITQIRDNIALGAHVTQSSTGWGGEAKRATDGNINPDYINGQSCTATSGEKQSWLVIDLGKVHNINEVKLFNRQDCCGERLQQFTVSVSDDSKPEFQGNGIQPSNARQCAYHHTAVGTDATINCNGKQGRYIVIAMDGILTLCEVEVSEGGYRNIALGARVTQSSIAFAGDAMRATDGNTNSNYHAKSCTHTRNEKQGWLVVDLGRVYSVNQVKLYNRQDCCSDRLQQFTVSLSYDSKPQFEGSSVQPVNARQCTYQHNKVGKDISISCNGKMGRYVTIAKNGILTLCEVEVTGQAKKNKNKIEDNRVNRYTNLALGACVKQSTIAWDGEADRATDGNTNPNYHGKSCTHTQDLKQSWLVVDLGNTYNINKVKLFNRQDCCSDRLQQFTVSVSNQRRPQFSGDNIQPTNARQCAFHHSVVGQDISISCRGMSGRYIMIARNGVLTLCEVEVYGRKNILLGRKFEVQQDAEVADIKVAEEQPDVENKGD